MLLVFMAAFEYAFRVLRWRRLRRCLGVLALVLLIAAGCGWIPHILLRDLQDEYASTSLTSFGARNVIILLGGGTEQVHVRHATEAASLAYSRLLKTLELYQACKRTGAACTIIVSGGDPQRHGATEAAVYAERLRQLTVPVNEMILEERSANTWQNAQFTRPLLTQLAPERVFLVSSGMHLRRSLVYFEHFGVDAIPVRADYLNASISLLPQAYNLALTDFAVHEYIGLLRFHIYNALGWNVPRGARLSLSESVDYLSPLRTDLR